MKTDKPKMSEAKRTLLEKYLRGELKHDATSVNNDFQFTDVESTNGRERVIPVQVGGSKRPFFFLHGDWTGRAFYCYPLARHLGQNQPFYILEPYNFDDLPIPPTFEEMAAAHLKSMQTIQPEGPYFLGGWCNGGLLAYEMALQLLAQGQEVDLLVLFDADGPHPAYRRFFRSVISRFCNLMRFSQDKQVDMFLLWQHIYRYLRFTHYRLRFADYRRSENYDQIGKVEHSNFKRRHSEIGFTFPRLDPLVPKSEVLRQDWPSVYEWIAYGYVPRQLYPNKITFLWDSEDTWRRVWWRKVIEAKADEAEVQIIPGTHYTLRMEDIHILAEYLHECLSRAQTSVLS